MVVSKEQNLENYGLIEKLVRSHFSLDSRSLSYFKEKLYKPTSDEFIENIFKNASEEDPNRVYFDIDENDIEDFDEGWKIFCERFVTFVNEFSIEFINYRSNKVIFNKNEYKIKKLLEKYYFDFESKPTDSFYFNYGIGYCMREFTNNPTDVNKEIITQKISEYIQKSLECIGEVKVPNSSNIKILITRDFADWFMCSTGSNWGSCLSLDSGTESCYWSGLPGLTGDPNRIMIAVIDGTTKSFKGITVPKTMCRSWAILDAENRFNVLSWYPSKLVEVKKIRKMTKLPIRLRIDEYFVSKRPVEILWFTNDYSVSIYQDNSGYFVDFKGTERVAYIGGQGNSLCDTYFYEHRIGNDCESPWEYYDGLSGLISSHSNLEDSVCNAQCCENCGDRIYDGDEYWLNDRCYCESCHDSLARTCEHCGEVFDKHDCTRINGDWYCTYCADNEVSSCERCGKVTPNDEQTQAMGESIDGEVCSSCREIMIDSGDFEDVGDKLVETSKCTYIESENEWYLNSYLERKSGQLKFDFETVTI